MHFEGITLAAVVAELEEKISGAFVQQVYQPLQDVLILHLYSGEKRKLLISIGPEARIHLTRQRYENPPAPPPFCMLLRKHLLGGRIKAVEQPKLERIVDLAVGRRDRSLTLRAELMGRWGNVILLEGEEVLGAMRPAVGGRSFAPHSRYEPPPSRGKLDPHERDRLLETLKSQADLPLKKALVGVLAGIGPCSAEELARRAGLDPQGLISSLSHAEMAALLQAVEGFFAKISQKRFEPCLYLRGGEPAECTPFPFVSYADLEVKSYESICEALDDCHRGSRQEPFEMLARELEKTLKGHSEKVQRAVARVERDLQMAKDYERFREMGDLLLAHLSEIQKGQSRVEVEDFQGGRRTIPLDPKLDPASNAQQYYKRYKKLKRGEERLKARLKELEMELRYLQSLEVHLGQAETMEDLRELQAELEAEGYLERPEVRAHAEGSLGPRSYNFEGFTILVGRSGRQNDELIRRAQGEDYWLHARDRPGAHVIVRCGRRGIKPPDEVLIRAAELAAYYSKGRGSSKVPVICTKVKYLRKPKGARPGSVIVTREEKTLMVAPKEA